MKNRTSKIAADHPALAALANEDLLDLNRNGLEDFAAETSIDYIDRMLRINNMPVAGIKYPDEIGKLNGEVAAAEFTRIFAHLMKDYAGEPHYITAVQVCYGADKISGELVLMYHPVLLIREEQTGNAGKWYAYSEKPINAGFYVCDHVTGLLTAITSLDAAELKRSYKKDVSIKSFSSPGTRHRPFMERMDAKLALFSFQQIFSMIYLQAGRINPLSVYHAGIRYAADPTLELRHSIVLSNYTADKKSGFYADLAHLCPPGCNVVFRLEQ